MRFFLTHITFSFFFPKLEDMSVGFSSSLIFEDARLSAISIYLPGSAYVDDRSNFRFLRFDILIKTTQIWKL